MNTANYTKNMKTPEEILRENGISMINYNHSSDYPSAVKAIKQAQKEAWNAALDAASKVIDGWPNRIMTLSEQQEEVLNLKK